MRWGFDGSAASLFHGGIPAWIAFSNSSGDTCLMRNPPLVPEKSLAILGWHAHTTLVTALSRACKCCILGDCKPSISIPPKSEKEAFLSSGSGKCIYSRHRTGKLTWRPAVYAVRFQILPGWQPVIFTIELGINIYMILSNKYVKIFVLLQIT